MGNCRIGIGSILLSDIKADEVLVVIDNLRASSTVVAALSVGVEEIIPVLDDEEAFSLKKRESLLPGNQAALKFPAMTLAILL